MFAKINPNFKFTQPDFKHKKRINLSENSEHLDGYEAALFDYKKSAYLINIV